MSSDLFMVRVGTGEPMFVMHGGLGFDHTYLRPWLDVLGDYAELVYFDFRGNGRSPVPESWVQTSHRSWIDDVESLRRTLGFRTVTVFGHSYGGYLAQEFALAYPNSIGRLVLCSTAPVFDFVSVAFERAQRKATPEQMALLQVGFTGPVADDRTMEEGLRTILPIYVHNKGMQGAVLDSFAHVRYRADAFNQAFFGCLPSFDVSHRLVDIQVPTLILGGLHDWIAPPECAAERLHAGIPNSRMVIFENSGHFPFIEEAEQFESVLRQWLVETREGVG